jgi:acetyl esterase/lipase
MISRDIHYSSDTTVINKHLLDVIYDREKTNRPVMIFIHGGSWMTGSKNLYTKLGENFLARGYVSVIINYRLFPASDVYGMISDCDEAFKWVIEHINEYGGDPSNIFLSGHSAGGHLAAVTGLNHRDDIKGMLLIDAFGLSALHFLTDHGMWIPEFLSQIFGDDKERWKLAAPDALIGEKLPAFYIMTGSNTYPFLTYDNEYFIGKLREMNVLLKHEVVTGKSHMQMIWMFEPVKGKIYEKVDSWVKEVIQTYK